MAGKVGRHTKLTPKLQQQICKLLSECVTIKDACGVVGIGETTYYRWLEQGESEEKRLADLDEEVQPSEEARPYWEFRQAVTRAEAKAKAVAAQTIFKGMHSQTATDVITETFTETRFDKSGKPYEYKRTTSREVLREIPADWRAAVEFLKRRDREQWGENIDVTSGGQPLTFKVVYADEVKPLEDHDDNAD